MMSIEHDIEQLESSVKAEIKRLGPAAAAKLVGCGRSYLCRLALGRVVASPRKYVDIAKRLGLKEV